MSSFINDDIKNNYYLKYLFVITIISLLLATLYYLFDHLYSPDNVVEQSVPLGIVFGFTLFVIPFLALVIVISDLLSLFILKVIHSGSLLIYLIFITLFGTIIGLLLLHYPLHILFSHHIAPITPEFWFPFLGSLLTGLCLVLIKKKRKRADKWVQLG